ncbi:RING finger protein [Operophtera brumata]|uniref:RING finger protein n=1 Tax=Operophtera brumata TaxID=104452 RepID=A0A0L7LBT1_OPEBR|nr:RING finger protein [Operophtera brumata]
MLEESRMDKKSSNRSAQPQSRANAIDCKKSSAPKNEQYRRNAPAQRGRGQVDKRPRPRGDTGYAVGGAQNTGLEDDEPEIGSVFVPGSKKHNMNHLLNFMYPSRGQPERSAGAGRGPWPQRHGDYKLNLLDPDMPVKWEQIEEVVSMRLVRRLRGSTVVEVAPPRGCVTEAAAPHILPLHYINDSPYCKLFAANTHQVQDILEREKKEIETQILAEIDTTEIVFMEQALNILKKKKESTIQFEEPKLVDSDDDETPMVYEKHEANGNKLDWFDVTEDGAAIDVVNQIKELKIDSNLNPDAPEFSVHLDNQPVAFPITEAECLTVKTEPEESDLTDIDKQNQAKYFYFYQAEDGQQVFLNSLNSRKHMPCTAHLPLHCAFDIVELELQPPNVTPRDERRRERAYRRAVEGPPRPDFSSDLVFPPAASFSSPPLDPSPLSAYDEASPSTSMASTSGTWRVRKTAPAPPPLADDDEESTAPRALSLSDAIEAALHAAPSPAGKKNKKSKQKILFATGMQRAP